MLGGHEVARHRPAHVGEHRHDEARLHREVVDVRRQRAQAVDDRLGLEQPVLEGELGESIPVDDDAEVLPGRRQQLGVDREAAAELELEVGVVAPQPERAQEHGRGELLGADPPRGEADGEAHGVDAARGAQLDVLRRDPLGGEAGAAQSDLIAEQVRQQRRAAGDELWQAPGVCHRDLDERFRALAVLQEGGITTEPTSSILQIVDCAEDVRIRVLQIALAHAFLRSGQRR